MPKTCDLHTCSNPVFGGHYCKNHQWLRTDKKPKTLKPKKAIRKTSKKQQSSLGERRELTRKDRLLWAEIWEERDHIDFETGQPICGEALTLYFHHVLGKRKTAYPQYRYEKWNIILVSWDTHTLAENSKWDKIPKIKAYRDELIKKYT